MAKKKDEPSLLEYLDDLLGTVLVIAVILYTYGSLHHQNKCNDREWLAIYPAFVEVFNGTVACK